MKLSYSLCLGLLVSMGAALSDTSSSGTEAAVPAAAPVDAPAPDAAPAKPETPEKKKPSKEKLCSDGKNKCSTQQKGKCNVPGSPINFLIFSWIDYKLVADEAC
ncbi:hypothetical protein PspLS_05261 [Pyricularia sp. CBS 133598]|nr:hypothetical protein PspLS_05261 [Pyricularia sp. CBS 133598]